MTASASNHYLLGAALARQQQWLDARSALQRAMDLQSGLLTARLELATVHIALGELALATTVLHPLQTSTDPLLIAKRARVQVRLSQYGYEAANVAAQALQAPPRLPESLLLEWLQIAGGLLLAQKFSEAR